jgi:hypothetical protein
MLLFSRRSARSLECFEPSSLLFLKYQKEKLSDPEAVVNESARTRSQLPSSYQCAKSIRSICRRLVFSLVRLLRLLRLERLERRKKANPIESEKSCIYTLFAIASLLIGRITRMIDFAKVTLCGLRSRCFDSVESQLRGVSQVTRTRASRLSDSLHSIRHEQRSSLLNKSQGEQ